MLALRIKVTLYLMMSFHCCYSQFNFHSSNINNLILGNETYPSDNAFAVFDNVSKISGSQVFLLGISAKSNYLIHEIQSYFAAVVIPFKNESFTIGLAYNGLRLYNESIIKLAYSRALSRKLKTGISFNLLQLYVQNYKTLYLYNFDLGFNMKADHHFVLSANISNPIPYQSSHWFNSLNYGSITFAINYMLSEKLNVSTVSTVKMEKPVRFNIGLNYKFIKAADLMVGISTNPFLFHIGFKFNKDKLKIGSAASYHQNLGISPQFNIQFINKGADE